MCNVSNRTLCIMRLNLGNLHNIKVELQIMVLQLKGLLWRFMAWLQRNLWPSYESVWDSFNIITCSSWYFSREELNRWLASNQHDGLRPEIRHPTCHAMLIVWLAFHVVRFATYLLLLSHYPGQYDRWRIIKPPFPYYFGSMLQYMYTFIFYANVACVAIASYTTIATAHLWLGRFGFDPQIGWFRVLFYIDAMINWEREHARTKFHLLRLVSHRQYRLYQVRFQLALRIQKIGFYLANVTVVNLYLLGIVLVWSHPEWNYPLPGVALFNLLLVLWYNFMAKIIFSLLMIFYFNARVVRMLLDSMVDRVTSQRHSRSTVIKLEKTVDETLRLLSDINFLWQQPLGNFYLFFLPAIMICLYLLLFEHLNPLLYFVLGYFVIALGFSMHFNSWTASAVRTTIKHFYRQLYHQKLIFNPLLSISNKFHLINIIQILGTRKSRLGIRIGPIGLADQKTSFLIFIVMLRIFMGAVKYAQTLH